jgi:hypothetical protein
LNAVDGSGDIFTEISDLGAIHQDDHVMLTPQDDFLGHQLPTTFDHVGTSDVRWTERYWYTAHP